MLPLDSVVADFGAGSGQYAKWLNDTGLLLDSLDCLDCLEKREMPEAISFQTFERGWCAEVILFV